MLKHVPTCHATLTRTDLSKPWNLDLIIAFARIDGVVHYETFSTTSRDDLVGLLSALGINGMLAPDQILPAKAVGDILPATPGEIVAALAAAPRLDELSLAACGCAGEEMAQLVAEARLVCVS